MAQPDMFLSGLAKQDPNMLLGGIQSSELLMPIIEKYAKTLTEYKAMSDAGTMTPKAAKAFKFQVLEEILTNQENVGHLKVLEKLQPFFTTYSRRMHHKIMVSETSLGNEFIIGGRNISDEYHISAIELKSKGKSNLLVGRNYPFIDSEVSGVFNPKRRVGDNTVVFK